MLDNLILAKAQAASNAQYIHAGVARAHLNLRCPSLQKKLKKIIVNKILILKELNTRKLLTY